MINPSNTSNCPNDKWALRIQNLSKQYGEFTAVDNLSFDIMRNEIFGLLGPNGAGKTTTINMICGLLPATGGQINFNHSYGNDRKTLIGYCPQENIFYPKLNCLEQLVFMGQMYDLSAKQAKASAMQLLEMLGLKEKTKVRAAALSGGMKRRLNICLALIHNPEILILDEPEAGLDPQSRILVRDFIKAFSKEKTIILTTHNMDEADRLADRIAIVDHGKLLLLDTPGNLRRTVGEGDILELVVERTPEEALQNFVDSLTSLSMKVKNGDGSLLISHPNIIEHVSQIKALADSSEIEISEFKLRENSLEDVFIHLTGRKLRA